MWPINTELSTCKQPTTGSAILNCWNGAEIPRWVFLSELKIFLEWEEKHLYEPAKSSHLQPKHLETTYHILYLWLEIYCISWESLSKYWKVKMKTHTHTLTLVISVSSCTASSAVFSAPGVVGATAATNLQCCLTSSLTPLLLQTKISCINGRWVNNYSFFWLTSWRCCLHFCNNTVEMFTIDIRCR